MEEKKEYWHRNKYSSLSGNTVIDYTHENGGKITVQALGLSIEKLSLETHNDLDKFAKALSDAWVDKVKLHQALRETIMGAKS